MRTFTRRAAMLTSAAAVTAAGAAAFAYEFVGPGGGFVRPGRSRARAVVGDSVLPRQVDVVVIGAGNVGTATALTLAERGFSVALCEKGVVSGEASGRSHGFVDSQFLDPVKMDLIGRSKELWRGMNARVEGETGYRPRGLVSLLSNAKDVEAAEAWLASVKGKREVNARLVSRTELQSLAPDSTKDWAAGLYQPSDGSAEPTLFAPAMADAARRRGAKVYQDCAVRGVETAAGRVCGVVTERGPIRADAVVIAGGAWAPLLAGALGLSLPQFTANCSEARLSAVDGPDVSGAYLQYCWRRQIDGTYSICATQGVAPITPAVLSNSLRLVPAMKHMWGEVIPIFNVQTFYEQAMLPRRWALDRPSPFEAVRILQPEIRYGVLRAIETHLKAAYPQFRAARRIESWAGVINTTLDNMPVISPVRQVPGLYLGTGFYYGLTMGPAAGEALADLVSGRRPSIDLFPYRYERFVDGSPIEFRA